jgi:hypothetical protein
MANRTLCCRMSHHRSRRTLRGKLARAEGFTKQLLWESLICASDSGLQISCFRSGGGEIRTLDTPLRGILGTSFTVVFGC